MRRKQWDCWYRWVKPGEIPERGSYHPSTQEVRRIWRPQQTHVFTDKKLTSPKNRSVKQNILVRLSIFTCGQRFGSYIQVVPSSWIFSSVNSWSTVMRRESVGGNSWHYWQFVVYNLSYRERSRDDGGSGRDRCCTDALALCSCGESVFERKFGGRGSVQERRVAGRYGVTLRSSTVHHQRIKHRHT